MNFAEFKDWFSAADKQLAGKPPDLKLWWELKARLEVVAPEVVASSSAPSDDTTTPAVTAALSASQRAQPVDDTTFNLPFSDLDADADSFRAFSRDKDGGLAAEAVDTLRRRR